MVSWEIAGIGLDLSASHQLERSGKISGKKYSDLLKEKELGEIS